MGLTVAPARSRAAVPQAEEDAAARARGGTPDRGAAPAEKGPPPAAEAPPPGEPEVPRPRRPTAATAAAARARARHDPTQAALERTVRERRTHVVRAGEYLSGIAAQHGVSTRALLDQNPRYRANPDLIHPGDVVVLPTPSRAIASTPPRRQALSEPGRAPTPTDKPTVAASPTTHPKPTSGTPPVAKAEPTAVEKPTAAEKPNAADEPTSARKPTVSALPARAAPPRTLETTEHAIVGRLPYTDGSATLTERAGYSNPAEARFRDVELIGADGETSRRRLLPFRNAAGVWADERGREYYLARLTTRGPDGTPRTQYRVTNEQPTASPEGTIRATRLPDGSMLVPSLGVDARDRKAQLEAQGYEVTAVLGTGFIDARGGRIVGYQYMNPARLRGESAPADAGKRVDGLGSGKIHAGYRLTRAGELRLLDFEGKDRNEIRAELRRLEADPDTAAINLFSHVAAERPADLVGVLGADTHRTKTPKARAMMVFDGDGRFVGHLQTPATSLLDSVTLARQVYGTRAAKVLNQDGDFYAQSWFADGRAGSSDRALHYDNAMLVVRRNPSVSPTAQPPWARAVDDARYWFDETVLDTARDAAAAADAQRRQVTEAVGQWWSDTTKGWSERLPR